MRRKKNNQREWSRTEMPEAPQGHGLVAVHGPYAFLAFEQDDGTWQITRTYDGEQDIQPILAESFDQVRQWVADATERLGGRQTNPTRGEELISMGGGALLGTVGGMLVGGIPGVLINSTALTILGSQTGGVVGAAAGAVAGARVKNSAKKVRKLKAKLLR